jgi:acyl-CoA hydrolase
MFYFRSSEFVNDPTVIARNDNLISISSALEVDLTGQVCTDSMGYMFYSGIGDQVDFLRGSAMSKGGFSVIALPSTAQNGKSPVSCPILSEGAGVATTRGDVNFVVTEYGIAELREKAFTSGSWNWPRSPTPNSGKNSSRSPKPGTTFFRPAATLPGRPDLSRRATKTA